MSVSSNIRFHVIAERRKGPKSPPVRGRILEQVRPCWLQIVGIVLLSLLAAPLGLLLPLPLKIVVDNIATGKPAPAWLRAMAPSSHQDSTLLLAAALLLTIGAIMHLHALATWILQTYTGERLVLDLRQRLFWNAQRLSLKFHDRRGSRATAYRIQHDAPAIQYVTIQGAVPLLSSAFAFGAMMFVTARLDWQLALLAVSVSPVLFLLARRSSVRVHDRWHKVKELDSKAMAVMDEALASVRLVKAFGREEREDERFLLRSSRRMWSQVRLAWIQAGYHTAIGLTIAVGTAVALLLGVQHVRAGLLTLGELLLVMSYMAQLYDPLRVMSSKLPELQSWLVSLERAFKLLDEIPEALDCPQARSLRRAEGAVRFENVSFAYGPQEAVLHNVSLTFPPGHAWAS